MVCHVGAKLVLIDTQEDSLEMDYNKLAEAITEKTKVIIPVDLGGVPCDYDRIFSIVEEKKKLFHPDNKLQEAIGRVIVMADAAHAFGATWHGKTVGSIADFSNFSFHAVKNFTTAEGGAVAWRDERYIKRGLDVIFAVIALPIVLVVCIIFGTLIWLEDRGTIFYLAKRRGKDGTIFNMYKLRSMKVNAPDIRNKDNSTFNSADDPRVTKIGKLMRKISVDELPQVFNILKGDMSWIGPRPVTTDRPLSEYDQKRKDRLKVKPGITGYTQAYYRNNISQEDKLALDAKYAQKVTFLGDLKIFFKTIETVVCRKNVYTN